MGESCWRRKLHGVLSRIFARLLAPARYDAPQAHTGGAKSQQVIIRLPDGKRAESTFVELKSERKVAALVLDTAFSRDHRERLNQSGHQAVYERDIAAADAHDKLHPRFEY